jgi:hypothetical protein
MLDSGPFAIPKPISPSISSLGLTALSKKSLSIPSSASDRCRIEKIANGYFNVFGIGAFSGLVLARKNADFRAALDQFRDEE